MTSPELRPLGLGETFDVAIKLYTRNAGVLLKVAGVILVPIAAIGAGLMAWSVAEARVEGSDIVGVEGARAAAANALFAADALISQLAYLAAAGAATAAVARLYLGSAAGVAEPIRHALRRFGSLLWLAIAAVIAVAIGFVLLIVPGVYLGVAFALALPALIVEDVRGIKALRRSRRLVTGAWWRMFAIVLIAYFLVPFIIGAVTLLAANAVLLASPASAPAFVLTGNLATTLQNLLAIPLQAGLVVVAYYDRRVRTEGLDLELLAAQEPEPANSSPDEKRA